MRWCRARDLFEPQIPVTTRGFELQISCIQSSYLTMALVTMVINKIQEFYIHLFQTNHLVNCEILPTNFIFPEKFNAEFPYVGFLFTDQNSNLPEIETLIIK